MPPKRQTYDAYSPKDWPDDFALAARVRQDEKKAGPERETVAVPSRIQGPISAADLYRLKEGIDGLESQSREVPEVGDKDRIVDRVVDEFGRTYLALRVRDDGTTDERWTYIRMPSLDDPDFEVPDDGGIQVGGRDIERPITPTAGSVILPSGEDSRRHTVTIVDSDIVVVDFSGTVNQFARLVVPVPEGYSGGQLTTRFYFYQAAAGSGNVEWNIQVKAATAGEAIPTFLGLWTSVVQAVDGVGKLYRTAFTSYFDVQSSPGRGDEFHFVIRRNTATAGNLAEIMWLSGYQTLYPKDRATDRAS